MTRAATPEAAPAPSVRDRIVDAALDCFRRYGIAKTTVEDVARAAGVSRPTVYRQFRGGRDEIVLDVLVRRGAVHYARIGRVMDNHDDLGDAVVAGVHEAIKAARTDEYLSMLVWPENAGLTALVVSASETMLTATRLLLEPHWERARAAGTLRPGLDLDDAAEWLVRVVTSFVVAEAPEARSGRVLDAYLRRFLVPVFVRDAPSAGRPESA